MEEKHIRILLDLSLLKDKPCKCVWMLISTFDLKSIADFKEAVIKKLALDQNDIEMYVNGGLLLEEENILVLRENDTVQIQYGNLSTSFNHHASLEMLFDSRISDFELNSEEVNENVNQGKKSSKNKKRKSEVIPIDISDCQMQNSNKRKKYLNTNDELENNKTTNMSQEEHEINFCDVNDESVCNTKKKKRKKSCSASAPKDISSENVQYNEIQHENASTFWDVKELSSLKKDKHVTESSPSSSKDTLNKTDNTSFQMNVSDCTDKIKLNKNKPHSPSNKILIKNDNEKNITPEIVTIEESPPDISNNSQSDAAKESFVQSNNCKKKKRRRHRKRKVEPNLVSSFLPKIVSTSPTLKKDNSLSFTPCDNFAGMRKHIRFTSPDIDCKKKDIYINSSDQNGKVEDLLEAQPSEKCISPYAGNLSLINEVRQNNTKSSVKTYSPKVYEPPPQETKLNFSISPWKIKNENGLLLQNTVSTSAVGETTTKNSKHSYEDYPTLNSLPSIGTCIAFKLLELNEYYSPEVSSYKEGILKSINPKTEEMEIELIKVEVKPGRIGKFENLKEDEIPPAEILQTVTACWSSLIEPRLVSPC